MSRPNRVYLEEAIRRKDIEIERLRTQVNNLIKEYAKLALESVPLCNPVTPTDVGKAFRKRSRAVTESSDNYSKDFAEF